MLNKLARLNRKKIPSILRLVNPGGVREGESVKKKILLRIQWVVKRMVAVMVAGFGVGFIYFEV